MNYQEYLELKRNCEKKLKLFNISIYIVTFFALFQSVLLIFKVNFTFVYTNMIILDKLFSLGYSQYAVGNVVFSAAFYAAYGLIILLFLYSCIYLGKLKRRAYYGVTVLYVFDTILCVATLSLIQMVIHIILLIFIVLAMRNRSNLKMLKNNVWGYQ